MPRKRGRPITIQGNDPAIIRRREKTAERVRRYNERKRADRVNALTMTTSRTGPGKHNTALAPRRDDSSVLMACSQLSALTESQSDETSNRPGASQWQSEQVDCIESSSQHDGVDIDRHDGCTGRYDTAVTMNLEDTTTSSIHIERSPDFAQRHNGLETQAYPTNAETVIPSRQEEVTDEVKQQLLSRRRHLAAARQRRYRDRQRILQGLPPRHQEDNLEHGETVISFAERVDNETQNTILSQPDSWSSGIRQDLGSQNGTEDEAQTTASSTVRNNNAQSCSHGSVIHVGMPSESTDLEADTEDFSECANVVERGQGRSQRANNIIDHHEGQQFLSIPPVGDKSLLVDPSDTSATLCTAQKLYDQLVLGFQGCSVDQHKIKLRDHVDEAGDNHFRLDQIFNHRSSPSVLEQTDAAKESPSGYQTPDGTQWNEMFCGIVDKDPQRTPVVKNVCLHKEQTKPTKPDVSFDIDSFLGFATSLGVARNGLLYQPSPLATQNLSSDVHFGLDVLQTNLSAGSTTRSSFDMLRDVPHFILGRLIGAENVTLHVFLPHLDVSQGTSILNTAQLTRWNDSVLHPAIYKHLPAHFTQHLPAGYQHALANSRARQIEARKIKTASYQSQQSISYCLPPQYLTRTYRRPVRTDRLRARVRTWRQRWGSCWLYCLYEARPEASTAPYTIRPRRSHRSRGDK